MGTRRVVAASNKVPNNWQDFLRDTVNKDSLNKFLAEAVTAHSFGRGKTVYATHEANVLSNTSTTMGDCNHEEADTRMLVHVEHSLMNGANQIGINSEDTDVLIILLGFFHQLQSKYNFSDVVIDFNRTKRYSISTLAEKLGSSVCQALPFFHALTGSDTTSAFKNVGKKQHMRSWSKCCLIFNAHFPHSFSILSKKLPKILQSSRQSSDLLSCFTQEPQHTHQLMKLGWICTSKIHIT